MVQENPSLVSATEPLTKTLIELGWYNLASDLWIAPDGDYIELSGKMLDLLDCIYMAGCHFGIQRVLYENETMEDCEKEDAELIEKMRALKKKVAIPTEV